MRRNPLADDEVDQERDVARALFVAVDDDAWLRQRLTVLVPGGSAARGRRLASIGVTVAT
jgi:hypothetical protein